MWRSKVQLAGPSKCKPSCQPTYSLSKGSVHHHHGSVQADKVLEKELRVLLWDHREQWKNWPELLRPQGSPPRRHSSSSKATLPPTRPHALIVPLPMDYGLSLFKPPVGSLFHLFFFCCLFLVLEIEPRASRVCSPWGIFFCLSPSIYLCLWI